MKTKAKRVISLLIKPVSNGNSIFFAMMYLLGLTSIILEPWNGSREMMTLELFSDLYILCALLQLIPHRLRHFARISLAIAFYILSVIDMFCYKELSTPITPTLTMLFLQTNMREASEVLTAYATGKNLSFPLLLIILQFAAGMYILCRKKFEEKARTLFFGIREKSKIIAKTLFLAVVAAGFLTGAENKCYMYYRIVRQYSELEMVKVREFRTSTHFYLPVYRLAFSFAEISRMKREMSEYESNIHNTQVDSTSYISPHIVVIIGESYNRHHSSLYGYGKMTTPRQLERMRKGELAVFKDIISTWNMTSESLKNVFSSHSIGQSGTWASAPPFPAVFKAAGYCTTFVSNQYVLGNNGFSDFTEDIFFNNPQTSSLLFDRRNPSVHQYDISLISDYRKYAEKKLPRLDIFHLLGSHSDYKERYPAGFGIFSEKDYRRADLGKNERQIIADYDNAVRYNDMVVDSILRLFENEDAIVIYVPDHGERVFDSSNQWGRNLSWKKGDIRQQFDIPFWIWSSQQYRTKHRALWERIMKSTGKRGMTDTLPQILYHIAGISTKWYFPQMDIISDDYNPDRKRIIREEKDYDKICNATRK